MENVFTDAKAIWLNGISGVNQHVDFYDEFDADTADAPFILNISVDSQYEAYVNNSFADCGQYSDYPEYKVYDSIDITEYVHEGKNALKIGGWCHGTDSSNYRYNAPSMIYEVRSSKGVCVSSSTNTLCCIEQCYKSGNIDKITTQLGFSFEYDGRQPDFFSSILPDNMENAVCVEKAEKYFPRPIKKLQLLPQKQARVITQGVFEHAYGKKLGDRMQFAALSYRNLKDMTVTKAPVLLPSKAPVTFSCSEGEGIYLVLDMMENDAGFIDLDVTLPHDTEILIGWGEHLDDLRCRTSVAGQRYGAKYTAHRGRNKFTCHFRRCSMRYMQLFFYSHEVSINYAGIIPTEYPLPQGAEFHTSDKLHQKIYEVSKKTLHMCMHEHYEDCPWREQSLYTMDSRNEMLFGYYAFGEFDMAKASLQLMALSMRDDGLLELCSPARVDVDIPCYTPIFNVQVQEYLAFSDDEEFAREMLPTCEKIADLFIAKEDSTGLIPAFPGYWNFYEWEPYLDGAGSRKHPMDTEKLRYDAPLNLFVSLCLKRTAIMEKRIGTSEKAKQYNEAADKLNKATNDKFVDTDGVYYSFANSLGRWQKAELTNSLAVYCGACAGDNVDLLLPHLIDKSLTPVSLSHSVFLYDALMTRPEKYGHWVFDHIGDVFGNMLYNGATTFWETENGSDTLTFDGGGSLCHGWSAVPVYLYYAYAVGARATENGADTTLCPVDSGLNEISASMRDVHGNIIKLC